MHPLAWSVILLWPLAGAGCSPRPASPGSASERGARMAGELGDHVERVHGEARLVEARVDPETAGPPGRGDVAEIRRSLESIQAHLSEAREELEAMEEMVANPEGRDEP